MRELSASALEDCSALLERIVAAQMALEPPGFFGDPKRSDLREATRAGLEAVLACLAGTLPFEEASEQARSAGRRQVQQNLPLEGVLRAYRVAGVEIWDEYVSAVRSRKGKAAEQLLDSARDLWTVIDAFSAAVSDGYRSEESLLSRRDDQVQESLLAALLDGRGAEPVFARDAATALGLSPDTKLVCVVASHPRPVPPPSRRRRSASGPATSAPSGEGRQTASAGWCCSAGWAPGRHAACCCPGSGAGPG